MTEEILLVILNELGLEKIKVMHGSEDTNIQFCCPFHGERHPSCGISVSKRIGKCFACGETFNLPKLVAYCKGMTYPQVYDYLQEMHYVDDRKVTFETLKRYEDFTDKEERFIQPFYKIAPFKSGKVIHPYMEERGFDEDDVEHFMLGWDANENRITIPVFWDSGELCGVIGRTTSKTVQPKYKIYEFPQSKIIYPFNHFTPIDKSAIIVEGTLDAMWLHKLGFRNAVSIINASVSHAQISLLQKAGVEHIILALDNDTAGENGCAKFYEKSKREFRTFKRLVYPKGKKDVQDMSLDEIKTAMKNLVGYPYMNIKRID